MKKIVFPALALLLVLAPVQLDARKVKFKNGDVYDGEWKNKAPNGQGLMMYANGEIYSGAWVNGLKEGSGAMSFLNGDQYSGDWKADVFSGEGKMTYANKDVYEGFWVAGKRHGEGTMTYADGSSYKGSWEAGLYHGTGTRTYADGGVYEGGWTAGVQGGKGRMNYASGASYEGYWENGKPSGEGSMSYAGGDIYTGHWKDGLRFGAGELYDKKHDRFLSGTWNGDQVSGRGSVRFPGDAALALQGEWQDDGLFSTYYTLGGRTFAGTVSPLSGDGAKGPCLVAGKVEWPDDMVSDGKWLPEVTLADCTYTGMIDGRARYKVDGKSFNGEIRDGKEHSGTLSVGIQGKFNFSGEVREGQCYGIYVGDFKSSPFTSPDISEWDEVQGEDIGRLEGENALSGVFKKDKFMFRGLLKGGLPDGESHIEVSRADSLSLNASWKEGRLIEGDGIMDTLPFTIKGSEEDNTAQADFENGDRCSFNYTNFRTVLSELKEKVSEQKAIREKLAAEMAASQTPAEPVAAPVQ